MKPLFKRLFKSAAFQAFLSLLIASYIRLVHYTAKRRMEIDPTAQPYMDGEKPAVFAFWHGRMLVMPMICPPKRKMHVLISTHRDGKLIADTMLRFNFGILKGSSTRGGATAAMSGVRALQAGENISITPDGPRGPLMQVQPGILTIAELAGVPIIPVTFCATPHKRMKSWDRFMVARPFGSLYYKIGPALMNPSRELLEAEMVRITEEVDKA